MPGQAPRFPGARGSQISRHSHEGGKGCQPYSAAAFACLPVATPSLCVLSVLTVVRIVLYFDKRFTLRDPTSPSCGRFQSFRAQCINHGNPEMLSLQPV